MMIKRTMAVQVLLLAAAVWAGYFLLNGPARAQEDEKEFVALFNGKDLAGWTGDTKNHVRRMARLSARKARECCSRKKSTAISCSGSSSN